MTVCPFTKTRKGWRCPACGFRYPFASPDPPMRNCETPTLAYNDLESDPCPHLGEVLRIVGCELCGKRDKLVQIHACQHPDKQGHEVTQERYSPRQFRTDVCRTCKLFTIATAPGRILDHDEPVRPVEKPDERAEEAET